MTHTSDDDDRGTFDDSTVSTDEHVKRPRSSSHRRRRPKDKQLPLWQEMILLLGIALVLAIVIKAFFMQAFYIPSGSMNNTLVLNDRILVEKVSYWGGGTPQRGDIVVFSDPGGWLNPSEVRQAGNPVARTLEVFGLYPTGGHLVKRVIGVGGDEVKCCDSQGRVTVNGVPLNEKSYLAPGEKPSLIDFDVKVHPGYLWVMGDNRSNSADSRVHLGDPGGGQVPADDVVGKVFAVVWPWDHAKIIHRPATFGSVPSR
ncbi:MAG: signal peptidase I [Nocardioidaceae bacterium]